MNFKDSQFKNTTRFKVIVSQLFAKKLDPQRTAETMEVFKKWDKNKDGELTLEEFRAGMKEATRLGDDEIDRIFKELDQDDNRVITVDELIVSSAFAALVAVDERLFDAFSEMDKDGDGFIEVKELKQAIKQLKLQDLGRAESIMDEIKTLKKGKINVCCIVILCYVVLEFEYIQHIVRNAFGFVCLFVCLFVCMFEV